MIRSRYTVISLYCPLLCKNAYEKFPFGRDWSIIGTYDECYAAIVQYLMKRYSTLKQSYDPMCLMWGGTREIFFEHGEEESCTVNGETMEIIKV